MADTRENADPLATQAAEFIGIWSELSQNVERQARQWEQLAGQLGHPASQRAEDTARWLRGLFEPSTDHSELPIPQLAYPLLERAIVDVSGDLSPLREFGRKAPHPDPLFDAVDHQQLFEELHSTIAKVRRSNSVFSRLKQVNDLGDVIFDARGNPVGGVWRDEMLGNVAVVVQRGTITYGYNDHTPNKYKEFSKIYKPHRLLSKSMICGGIDKRYQEIDADAKRFGGLWRSSALTLDQVQQEIAPEDFRAQAVAVPALDEWALELAKLATKMDGADGVNQVRRIARSLADLADVTTTSILVAPPGHSHLKPEWRPETDASLGDMAVKLRMLTEWVREREFHGVDGRDLTDYVRQLEQTSRLLGESCASNQQIASFAVSKDGGETLARPEGSVAREDFEPLSLNERARVLQLESLLPSRRWIDQTLTKLSDAAAQADTPEDQRTYRGLFSRLLDVAQGMPLAVEIHDGEQGRTVHLRPNLLPDTPNSTPADDDPLRTEVESAIVKAQDLLPPADTYTPTLAPYREQITHFSALIKNGRQYSDAKHTNWSMPPVIPVGRGHTWPDESTPTTSHMGLDNALGKLAQFGPAVNALMGKIEAAENPSKIGTFLPRGRAREERAAALKQLGYASQILNRLGCLPSSNSGGDARKPKAVEIPGLARDVDAGIKELATALEQPKNWSYPGIDAIKKALRPS